jgi:ATP-binding cassette, subfamily B, multidrug efflux pump
MSGLLIMNEDYVLKDISFKINPGETVAIVGHTGAGKTSIINILTRFYDINKGSIFIDGIDISQADKNELKQTHCNSFQDVFLFSGTIKSNISMDNENVLRKELLKLPK